MKHFAHYVKRSVVDASQQTDDALPLYVEHQPHDQGFQSPAYHSVAANSGVASRVSKGDTIWLFSQLSSPWGSLKPSLDAIIKVSEIKRPECHASGRYRFQANDDSRWFPLFDATELISRLVAIDSQGNSRALLNTRGTSIGQALQFLREIYDPTPLLEHMIRVSETPLDFVSYRIIDGTRPAFELTKCLLDEKRAVFWDRWSLPRRLSERGENIGNKPLDSHVYFTIGSARIVWGVVSALYAASGSYSAKEKELAISLKKFKEYPQLNDGCSSQ